MDPSTDKEKEYYDMQKKCYICKKSFAYDEEKDTYINYRKVRDYCHFTRKVRGATHSICNLRYRVPREISVIFHNGSKYDYHFIIKELAEEFKGEDFECLAEKSEKYITFSVQIRKEFIKDTIETITYKIKFIDSFRFMRSSLSGLVDNLSEINIKDCNTCTERKKILIQNANLLGLKIID